jgi:hypothetical protein
MTATDEQRLRQLAPITDEEVRELALDGERDLRDAITATRRPHGPLARLRYRRNGARSAWAGRPVRGSRALGAPARHRPQLAALVASVALAALALGALVAVVAGGGSRPPGGPAGHGATVAPRTEDRAPTPEVERALDQMASGLAHRTRTAKGVVVPSGAGPGETQQRSQADPARAPPHYLLGTPGDGVPWTVTRADEYGRDGEMTFERDGRRLDLHWRTGSFEQWVSDRANDAVRLPRVDVGGEPADVFEQSDASGWFTALWRLGDRTMELRVSGPDSRSSWTADEFDRALRSLRTVSEDEWLAAMPQSAVTPATRPQVVREMLADVPLPDGFDATPLERGSEVKDRYQLGAEVLGEVACAWIDRWSQARSANDQPSAKRAALVMTTARRWAEMRRMAREGGWPDAVDGFGRAMLRDDGMIQQGKPMRVERAASEAFGCG